MPYRLFIVFVSLAFTCPLAAVAGEQQAGETAKGTARISITIPERLDVRAAEPEAGVLCVQTAVHYRVSVLKPGERAFRRSGLPLSRRGRRPAGGH